MRVCLYEDRHVLGLEPLTLTRPAYDLLCGLDTLGEKQFRAFDAGERGAVVRPHLAEVARAGGMAVNDRGWLAAGPVVLVNARWLPPASLTPAPGVGLCQGEVAYVALDDADALDLDELREGRLPLRLPRADAPGRMLRHLWELVDLNGDQIGLDAWHSAPTRPRRDDVPLALIGPPQMLWVHPSARIEPHVVADACAGPVVIDADAVVTAFTRLEGPCYVGPGTRLHSANLRAGSSLGPDCRVGGEVEASVVLGRSNKYHDGFLGHSYVGEWVNLGAGTSNSDLRNDYGEVGVPVRGELVATGRNKVGCFLGDHVKSGLGVLLNTGTSAGAFAQLLPTGGLLPKHVPSFSAVWDGSLVESGDLDALFATAATVMARRGRRLTEALREVYRRAYDATAGQRRAAVREAEARRLRRVA